MPRIPQAFLTTVGSPDGSIASYRPAVNTIHHNFIVSNNDADGGAIDNDDGSSYYDEYANFCIYGGAKMANIDGHAKVYHSNINAYANVYGKTCNWQWPGWFPEQGTVLVLCTMDSAIKIQDSAMPCHLQASHGARVF